MSNNLIKMLVKSLFILAFIGCAVADDCSPLAFATKCNKYTELMQEIMKAGITDLESINKMCCVINLQVTCITDMNCGDKFDGSLSGMKAQLGTVCGDYTFEESCLGGPGGATAESGGAQAESGGAEAESESSGAAEGADCSMLAFLSKCNKYTEAMNKTIEEGINDAEGISKMCCVTSGASNCIADMGCEDQYKEISDGLTGQLKTVCGDYKFEESCLEPLGLAEAAEGESKDPNGANEMIPSLLTLTAALTVLFRIYH